MNNIFFELQHDKKTCWKDLQKAIKNECNPKSLNEAYEIIDDLIEIIGQKQSDLIDSISDNEAITSISSLLKKDLDESQKLLNGYQMTIAISEIKINSLVNELDKLKGGNNGNSNNN